MADDNEPEVQRYVTREEAITAGSLVYMGKPCIYGHTCGRYVSSQDCIDCMKAYRKRNVVHIKAKKAADRIKNRVTIAADRKQKRESVAAELKRNQNATVNEQVPAIRTRDEAIALGVNIYTKCRPCVFGHPVERYVQSHGCVECARLDIIRRRAACTAAANGASVVKGPRCRKCGSMERYASGPCVNCTKAAARRWYAQNTDRVVANTRSWLARHPEKRAIYAKTSALKNPDGRRSNVRNRRARLRNAPGHHTAADIQRIYKAQKGRCAHCRKLLHAKYHVDHITPLARRGSNWPRNIQLLCQSCNLKKSFHDPIDHAQSRGLLL